MDTTEVDAAWAEVRARWEDEAAHRAFLDRHPDLEGLAEAGRRYKAALDAAPADPVAARWRDEIVRRATVVALSQLPRTKPPRRVSPGLRRLLMLALASGTVAAVAWAFLRLSRAAGGAP
ncbi:hypothetical protein [Anaeromyxobacter diazotrophicus]|uniref:Uncharacterized protein n=1 Tax=Anaeromyxobacter diazotrophicus TaxID=2590199 RepID=A0A7I9VMM4_9BACT|nr:hypothetical protein [Anaeromyxobacter diazotrophicus]GEJ57653.1 hypothetical protein AMYX_23940 [Anaeromyxobacter diazotrophicus]